MVYCAICFGSWRGIVFNQYVVVSAEVKCTASLTAFVVDFGNLNCFSHERRLGETTAISECILRDFVNFCDSGLLAYHGVSGDVICGCYNIGTRRMGISSAKTWTLKPFWTSCTGKNYRPFILSRLCWFCYSCTKFSTTIAWPVGLQLCSISFTYWWQHPRRGPSWDGANRGEFWARKKDGGACKLDLFWASAWCVRAHLGMAESEE